MRHDAWWLNRSLTKVVTCFAIVSPRIAFEAGARKAIVLDRGAPTGTDSTALPRLAVITSCRRRHYRRSREWWWTPLASKNSIRRYTCGYIGNDSCDDCENSRLRLGTRGARSLQAPRFHALRGRPNCATPRKDRRLGNPHRLAPIR